MGNHAVKDDVSYILFDFSAQAPECNQWQGVAYAAVASTMGTLLENYIVVILHE